MLQDSFRVPARKKFAFCFLPICIGEVVLNLWSGLPNTQVGLSDAPRFSAKYSALVYLESNFELIVSNMVSWGASWNVLNLNCSTRFVTIQEFEVTNTFLFIQKLR